MSQSIGRDVVEFAHVLADAAGEIVRAAARSRQAVHHKADASPVTEIDHAVEIRLREMIAARYPDHGVIGEEFGDDRPGAEHVWVLDPIDGTKAFVVALPAYGTLIGFASGGRPVLGVVEQPVTRERWTGIDGEGTWYNGERIRADACERLSDALVCTTSPEYYEGEDALAYRRIVSGSGGWCTVELLRVRPGRARLRRLGARSEGRRVRLLCTGPGRRERRRGDRVASRAAHLEPAPGGRVLAGGNRAVHEAAMACLAGEG